MHVYKKVLEIERERERFKSLSNAAEVRFSKSMLSKMFTAL